MKKNKTSNLTKILHLFVKESANSIIKYDILNTKNINQLNKIFQPYNNIFLSVEDSTPNNDSYKKSFKYCKTKYNEIIFNLSIHYIKQMGIYDEFINNLKKSSICHVKNLSDYKIRYSDSEGFDSIINYAFIWRETNEGQDYWLNVERELFYKIKHFMLKTNLTLDD